MNVMGEKFKNEKNGVTIKNGFHFLLKVVSILKILESTKA
jgi:hypothetical protein